MDSPFTNHLHTNYVPTFAEICQISDLISLSMNKLSSMNSEIIRIQTILDDLTRERDELAKEVDAHNALISPARRLPNELFQEIFVRCLPTKRNAAMSAREAPVLLCRVCSPWRSIALSTPQLWSSIHAVIPSTISGPHDKLRLRLDCLNTWLNRSGVCPLSISLFTPDLRYYPEEIAQFIESLVSFSRQWKFIELRVPCVSLKPFFCLTKEDVPMLETIKIHDTTIRTRGRFHWENMAIFGAPYLRGASLFSLDSSPLILPLPWSQLTELRLEGDPYGYVLDAQMALGILHQCPRLITCTLHVTSSRSSTGPGITLAVPEGSVTIPALLSLRIEINGDIISSLLHRLILPEVHDISLKGLFSHVGLTQLESFTSLLARSRTLRSLTLDTDLRSEAIIDCLRNTPSLTRLHVVDPHLRSSVQDALLHMLTPTEWSRGLCPALEFIRFAECAAFSDEALLVLIQARAIPLRQDVVCLKHIRVSAMRCMQLDILPHLQSLIATGLQVSLCYSPDSQPSPVASPWAGLEDELPPL